MSLDELLTSLLDGFALDKAEARRQLRRWFQSSQGQHRPRSVGTKGDLLRWGGSCGLPTVREDLAQKVDELRVNKNRDEFLDFVLSVMSEQKLSDLRRLAP